MAICKLCLKERDLIKKSHIIPRFINKLLLTGDENQFYVIHKIPEKGINKHRLVYDSCYESDLLCIECDNLIGKLETYAANVLANKNLPYSLALNITHLYLPNGKFFQICNVDYTKFKLFCLSLVWRASIAHGDFFKDVNLGKKHEEIIRQMILNNDAKGVNDYPIEFATFNQQGSERVKLIAPPRKIKDGYNTFYRFSFVGLLFIIHIRLEMNLYDKILNNSILPSNTVMLRHIPMVLGINISKSQSAFSYPRLNAFATRSR